MITGLKGRLASILGGLLAVLIFTAAPMAHAQEASSSQTAWRLLDYLSVDYAGAVKDGKVISPSEYAEMNEFAGQVRERIAGLPATKAQPDLLAKAQSLQATIAAKQEPAVVSAKAHALANDLLAAYPTPLAPKRAPDLARGAALYAENCAACHGETGKADGPNAAGLDPPPIAFADAGRARQRSVFGLYQVIQQGLDGTAMASYAHLPSDDRWDLAFYVGRFAFSDAEAAVGEKLWNEDAAVRARFPDLQTLTQTTPAALATTLGETKARALTAYLRRHPEVVTRTGGGSLDVARQKLAASLKAYEAGDRKAAADLALAGADVVVAGHIHKPQEWEHGGVRILAEIELGELFGREVAARRQQLAKAAKWPGVPAPMALVDEGHRSPERERFEGVVALFAEATIDGEDGGRFRRASGEDAAIRVAAPRAVADEEDAIARDPEAAAEGGFGAVEEGAQVEGRPHGRGAERVAGVRRREQQKVLDLLRQNKLPKGRSEVVRAAIEALWPEYQDAVRDETPTPELAAHVFVLSERMFDVTDRLTASCAHATGTPLAAYVYQSGRNRVLSQRITKFFLNQDDAAIQPQVATLMPAACSEFETNLHELAQSAGEHPELVAQLKVVAAQWQKFVASLNPELLQGGPAKHARKVLLESERLLRCVETMVKLFERLTAKPADSLNED